VRRGCLLKERGNPKGVAGAWGCPLALPSFMWVDTPLTKILSIPSTQNPTQNCY